jgi:hypothetical protein
MTFATSAVPAVYRDMFVGAGLSAKLADIILWFARAFKRVEREI